MRRTVFYLGLCLWLLVGPSVAQEAPATTSESAPATTSESAPATTSEDLSYAPLWIGDRDTGIVPEQDLQATLDAISPKNPKNIVVLIHGFDTTREEATSHYQTIAPILKEEFAKNGSDVAVVGVQWDSAVQGFILALPWAYLDTVKVSHKVGRQGVRQLLLALKEKYPDSRITVLAHSMGCEVTGAALRPDWTIEKDPGEIFRAGESIPIHGVVFLGSDLDYDVAFKGGVSATQKPANLYWLSMSRVTVSRFERDRVLEVRSLFRGKASGAAFPRMTEEQYDNLFKSRAVVFDNTDIPTTHHFTSYASPTRLAKIVPALIHKADPSTPRPEVLKEIDEVLDGPGGVEALTPWFAQPDLTPQIYALWRLEHEKCGSAKHLTDETLSEAARVIRSRPRAVYQMQTNSACVNLRERNWPSPLILSQFGAPDWAPRAGNTWIRYFRGEVTALDGESLNLKTDDFGLDLVFDLEETRTKFTPGMEALKVGSKIEIAVDGPDALAVTILPYSVWLKRQK